MCAVNVQNLLVIAQNALNLGEFELDRGLTGVANVGNILPLAFTSLLSKVLHRRKTLSV